MSIQDAFKAQDVRRELVQRVSEGADYKAMEEEAERLGVGPLAFSPDLTKYDPMELPAWSLVMAAVWIATRTTEQVTRNWSAYTRDQLIWRYIPALNRYELRAPERRCLGGSLGISPEQRRIMAEFFDIEAATRQLWAALGNGEVTATARDRRFGPTAKPVTVPSEEWSYLSVQQVPPPHSGVLLPPPGQPEPEDVLSYGPGPIIYVDVFVSRRELIDRFPAASDGPAVSGGKDLGEIVDASREASQKGKRVEARRWLISQIKASPDAKLFTKDEFYVSANAQFGTSDYESRGAWQAAIEELESQKFQHVWSKKGRPTKTGE